LSCLANTKKGTREMNNEPVAWIDPKELDMAVSTSVTKNKQFDTDIPLYTYEQITASGFLNASKPIYPAKTLTDEETLNLWWDLDHTKDEDDVILTFAKIILKEG